MMRRLVKRHKGILPLDTAESIWRVIISTFTYVQAPFSVHADLSAGDALMRDSARFHFGFTVPVRAAHGRRRRGRGGVRPRRAISAWCRRFAVAGAGAWWSALEFDAAPKIIARLPFVERADHPAALPVFVVSRVAADAMATEAEVWSVRVVRLGREAARRRSPRWPISSPCPTAPSTAPLCWSRCPRACSLDAISEALVKAGATVRSAALVGSHATRYTVAADDAHVSTRPAGTVRERTSLIGMTAATDRNRAPACSTSRPTCRARAARPASPRCSSCPPTRRRWGRARSAIAAYRAAAEHLEDYPDGSATALREAIGEAFGLDPGAHRLRRRLRRSAQSARARLSRRRRRGDLHHARLPGLSDRDARHRRQAGGRAGDELHRRRRRDPRAR